MPQIWMTYNELGALCGCGAMEARERAIHLSLDRRKSRGGTTRVKLNLALMARFFETIREAEFDLDGAITALRDTHQQMSGGRAIEYQGQRRGAA